MMVVRVLMINCQVSVNPKNNPPIAQRMISKKEKMLAAGLPDNLVTVPEILLNSLALLNLEGSIFFSTIHVLKKLTIKKVRS